MAIQRTIPSRAIPFPSPVRHTSILTPARVMGLAFHDPSAPFAWSESACKRFAACLPDKNVKRNGNNFIFRGDLPVGFGNLDYHFGVELQFRPCTNVEGLLQNAGIAVKIISHLVYGKNPSLGVEQTHLQKVAFDYACARISYPASVFFRVLGRANQHEYWDLEISAGMDRAADIEAFAGAIFEMLHTLWKNPRPMKDFFAEKDDAFRSER